MPPRQGKGDDTQNITDTAETPFPTAGTKDKFVSALRESKPPKEFHIYCFPQYPKSCEYARNLLDAIRLAGWPNSGVVENGPYYAYSSGSAITAFSIDYPGVASLQQAMTLLGMPIPPFNSVMYDSGIVSLYIGPRQ